jgi:septum formation protein
MGYSLDDAMRPLLAVGWRPPDGLPPLVLASNSPRRRELLRAMGLAFEVMASDASEPLHPALTPAELCRAHARRKALAIAGRRPEALVLGADTLVYLDGRQLGKPANLDEARGVLESLQGRVHQVITAVCLVGERAARERIFADHTEVTFRRLDAAQIREYLAKVDPLDKAGAYGIQEHGGLIVSHVDGSLANVIGLPVERLARELDAFVSPSVEE